jgi:hypothetical protein
MRLNQSANCTIAALATVMMLTMPVETASAFSLAAPNLGPSIAASQIGKVWWRRWGCGWGCGWGPAAVIGGVAAGVVVGSALAARPAYGPCWRQVADPYGNWHWQRIC